MDRHTVCVRFPGRGSTTVIGENELYVSHEYRTFGIDSRLFLRILRCVRSLHTSKRFVLVPSGAGVYLLADLARRLGLDSIDVDSVSRNVINAQSQLIYRWLVTNGVSNAVIVDHPADLTVLPAECSVAVVKPTPDFKSTDALWSAAAFYSKAQFAFIFKHPSGDPRLSVSSTLPFIDLQSMLKDIDHLRAEGAKLVFDSQCLHFLLRAKAITWILRFDYPEDMARICNGLDPRGLSKRLLL